MDKALEIAHTRMRQSLGLIRRADALTIPGMTCGRIEGLVRRRRWEVVEPGVYRAAGSHVPAEQPHLAAVWRAGPDALLTAESVMGLFGVEGFGLDSRPVVLCPTQRRVRGVGFEVRYRPRPPLRYVVSKGPLPIAAVPRAFVDLALRVRGKRFRVAFDSARRLGVVVPERLREAAVAALPQRGAQWVIDTVDSGVLRHESEPERVVAALFDGFAPPLEFQAWLLPDVRVDAVWRDARLVIEYDGVAFHSLPTDRAHDRERRKRLEAAGWSVMVITKEALDDPVALRRRVLERRVARLRGLR
jgi:hypothetical protein